MPSPFETICQTTVPSLESGGAGHAPVAKPDTVRHISPVVAHELNNLLTIIQGYADRLLSKHGENAAIQAQLKLISDASRRAATVVRNARNQETKPHPLVPTV